MAAFAASYFRFLSPRRSNSSDPDTCFSVSAFLRFDISLRPPTHSLPPPNLPEKSPLEPFGTRVPRPGGVRRARTPLIQFTAPLGFQHAGIG